MTTITLQGGKGKDGQSEALDALEMQAGEIYAIVGNTGSGKSRLIKDIEQLVYGDSLTQRRVLLNGTPVDISKRSGMSNRLIAHLGQNMRFVLDMDAASFIKLHQKSRGRHDVSPQAVLELANRITPEHIRPEHALCQLSGGQTRALMIADIALICDSPVVLIDEIENAGINKVQALEIFLNRGKLVLIVTHDPHTALLADARIVMQNGAIAAVLKRTEDERLLFEELEQNYAKQLLLQDKIRRGEVL